MIQNIADSRPKVRYIIAVDDSKNTMEEIVKVRLIYMQLQLVFHHCCYFYIKEQSSDKSALIMMHTLVLLIFIL